jgi:hypothetical protein
MKAQARTNLPRPASDDTHHEHSTPKPDRQADRHEDAEHGEAGIVQPTLYGPGSHQGPVRMNVGWQLYGMNDGLPALGVSASDTGRA